MAAKKILVVSDDMDLIKNLARVLRGAHYRVIQNYHPSSEIAVRAAKIVVEIPDAVDLVITTDLVYGDGVVGATQIKEAAGETPVILISQVQQVFDGWDGPKFRREHLIGNWLDLLNMVSRLLRGEAA